MISASDDSTLILWDKEFKQKSFHKGITPYTKVIKVGERIVVSDADGGVEIYNNNLEILSTITGHTSSIWDMCNIGEKIITGSGDRTVRISDINSGKCTQVLEEHTSWIRCMHVHSTTGFLITGSWDCTLRVWDINTGSKSIALFKYEDYLSGLVELDIGRMLSICKSRQSTLALQIWELKGDPDTGYSIYVIKEIHNPPQAFMCGLMVHDTKGVLLGGTEGSLMLLDVETYEFKSLMPNLHGEMIMQMKEIKQDIYVTCSEDKSIKIVNIATQKVLHTLLGHTFYVNSILPIFSADKE